MYAIRSYYGAERRLEAQPRVRAERAERVMHEGWMRTRTPDGSDPPAHLLWFARKAMGDLLEAAKKGGLSYNFV